MQSAAQCDMLVNKSCVGCCAVDVLRVSCVSCCSVSQLLMVCGLRAVSGRGVGTALLYAAEVNSLLLL